MDAQLPGRFGRRVQRLQVLKNKLSSSHVISHRLVFHLEWHIVSKCCRFIVGESFFVFFSSLFFSPYLVNTSWFSLLFVFQILSFSFDFCIVFIFSFIKVLLFFNLTLIF